MANLYISSESELTAEIVRLRALRDEQGAAIKARFSSPGATFSTISSIFFKPGSSILHQDFFGMISRVLLPLTLNKTLFRNSGFLVKGLVGFLSQKASHFISEDTVVGLWDKVKSVFNKKEKKVDYGIPPDSEAS